jgi:YD repeat-containing protein
LSCKSIYTYDSSGHTTGISPNATNTCPIDASSTCLSYDAQGRLVKVTKASALTVTMSHNAQGQRMSYAASGGGANLSESFLIQVRPTREAWRTSDARWVR